MDLFKRIKVDNDKKIDKEEKENSLMTISLKDRQKFIASLNDFINKINQATNNTIQIINSYDESRISNKFPIVNATPIKQIPSDDDQSIAASVARRRRTTLLKSSKKSSGKKRKISPLPSSNYFISSLSISTPISQSSTKISKDEKKTIKKHENDENGKESIKSLSKNHFKESIESKKSSLFPLDDSTLNNFKDKQNESNSKINSINNHSEFEPSIFAIPPPRKRTIIPKIPKEEQKEQKQIEENQKQKETQIKTEKRENLQNFKETIIKENVQNENQNSNKEMKEFQIKSFPFKNDNIPSLEASTSKISSEQDEPLIFSKPRKKTILPKPISSLSSLSFTVPLVTSLNDSAIPIDKSLNETRDENIEITSLPPLKNQTENTIKDKNIESITPSINPRESFIQEPPIFFSAIKSRKQSTISKKKISNNGTNDHDNNHDINERMEKKEIMNPISNSSNSSNSSSLSSSLSFINEKEKEKENISKIPTLTKFIPSQKEPFRIIMIKDKIKKKTPKLIEKEMKPFPSSSLPPSPIPLPPSSHSILENGKNNQRKEIVHLQKNEKRESISPSNKKHQSALTQMNLEEVVIENKEIEIENNFNKNTNENIKNKFEIQKSKSKRLIKEKGERNKNLKIQNNQKDKTIKDKNITNFINDSEMITNIINTADSIKIKSKSPMKMNKENKESNIKENSFMKSTMNNDLQKQSPTDNNNKEEIDNDSPSLLLSTTFSTLSSLNINKIKKNSKINKSKRKTIRMPLKETREKRIKRETRVKINEKVKTEMAIPSSTISKSSLNIKNSKRREKGKITENSISLKKENDYQNQQKNQYSKEREKNEKLNNSKSILDSNFNQNDSNDNNQNSLNILHKVKNDIKNNQDSIESISNFETMNNESSNMNSNFNMNSMHVNIDGISIATPIAKSTRNVQNSIMKKVGEKVESWISQITKNNPPITSNNNDQNNEKKELFSIKKDSLISNVNVISDKNVNIDSVSVDNVNNNLIKETVNNMDEKFKNEDSKMKTKSLLLPDFYMESPLTKAKRLDSQNHWREEKLKQYSQSNMIEKSYSSKLGTLASLSSATLQSLSFSSSNANSTINTFFPLHSNSNVQSHLKPQPPPPSSSSFSTLLTKKQEEERETLENFIKEKERERESKQVSKEKKIQIEESTRNNNLTREDVSKLEINDKNVYSPPSFNQLNIVNENENSKENIEKGKRITIQQDFKKGKMEMEMSLQDGNIENIENEEIPKNIVSSFDIFEPENIPSIVPSNNSQSSLSCLNDANASKSLSTSSIKEGSNLSFGREKEKKHVHDEKMSRLKSRQDKAVERRKLLAQKAMDKQKVLLGPSLSTLENSLGTCGNSQIRSNSSCVASMNAGNATFGDGNGNGSSSGNNNNNKSGGISSNVNSNLPISIAPSKIPIIANKPSIIKSSQMNNLKTVYKTPIPKKHSPLAIVSLQQPVLNHVSASNAPVSSFNALNGNNASASGNVGTVSMASMSGKNLVAAPLTTSSTSLVANNNAHGGNQNGKLQIFSSIKKSSTSKLAILPSTPQVDGNDVNEGNSSYSSPNFVINKRPDWAKTPILHAALQNQAKIRAEDVFGGNIEPVKLEHLFKPNVTNKNRFMRNRDSDAWNI